MEYWSDGMRRLRSFTEFVLFIAVCLVAFNLPAAEVKDRAEAEGKLMFYATFNAADSKTLTDGFKQLYPKIDATFYRSTDAALMERILTESRAGQNLWDVVVTTSFYGHNLKKRGMFAFYDSPERGGDVGEGSPARHGAREPLPILRVIRKAKDS